MRNTFSLVLLFLFFLAAHANVPATAELDVSFYPSFSQALNMRLTVDSGAGKLYFKTGGQSQWILRDSVVLSEIELQAFFAKADSATLLGLRHDPNWKGFDGITVAVKAIMGKARNDADLWSPVRVRHPEAYKLLDALFALAYPKFPRREAALEDVQSYFDYGLPVKLKSTAPLIYRIYGGLSIDDQPALQRFFDSIPDSARVIFDLSNFHGMGRLLDDDFKKFDHSHPNVLWVTPGYIDNYFAMILSPRRRVETLEEAIQRVGK